MMPASTVSLVVPIITSNVYAMYILSKHYLLKLSTDCVIDNSDMFKNKVDTYLSRADYT